MKKSAAKLLAIVVFLICTQASATNYYFKPCDTGAQAGCVVGSNSNAGTSTAAPKENLFGFDLSALAAGDQVLFTRGTAWTSDKTATVTISIASPAVVTWPSAHGFPVGTLVYLTNSAGSGGMPTGVVNNATYCIKSVPSSTTFTIGFSCGGGTINTSGTQSGTITGFSVAQRINNKNATATSPIVIGSYDDSWSTGLGAGDFRPVFNYVVTNSNGGCFDWSEGTTSLVDGGYTIQDIRFIHASAGQMDGPSCMGIINESNYITFKNIEVNGFTIGINITGPIGGLGTGADGYSKYLTLRDSTIKNNGEQGMLGCHPHILVENNVFDNNGHYPSSQYYRNHNFYASAGAGGVCTGHLRGNTFTKSAVCSNNGRDTANCTSTDWGKCMGSSFVMHQTVRDFVVENNNFDESTGATGGCYGIDIDPGNPGTVESYTRMMIRDNSVVNVGSNGINLGANVNSSVIGNHVVWSNAPAYTTNGIVGTSGNVTAGEDAVDTGLTVENNSVYLSGTASGNTGIIVNAPPSGTSLNNVVSNNLIYFPSGSNVGARCFSFNGMTGTNFTSFTNNQCYREGGVNTWSSTPSYATLAAAQAAGFDANGSVADPTLSATPASGNGYVLAVTGAITGNATYCPKLAYRSVVYTGTCKAGAKQNGFSTVAPATPTRIEAN